MSSPAQCSVAKRLEGKVALITGGASGIGESTARLFLKHGAKVLIADVQDELGQSLCKELGTPDIVTYIHCDVTCETDVQNAVDLAVSRYGKLDIMFNNAGIVGGDELRAIASDGDSFKKVLDVNVVGGFLGAKHAARVMHAIVGLAKSLSVELGGHGIRVNCISPHAVATPLLLNWFVTSDKRKVEESILGNGVLKGTILEAEDVAQSALFLASDEAKYVSGVNLPVDGAYSINNQTWKKGLMEDCIAE
ncbi:hypothetical protein CXB51_002349 [Gossypium anomalum]|uniref:Uncharacterized protein n=1 Tax=Gossypium anomalum TaxID=47600 RepID=A0A8J6DA44_9ROSI|nr:hypothetical protein CXB51_002349 [Gossypium anomalum]